MYFIKNIILTLYNIFYKTPLFCGEYKKLKIKRHEISFIIKEGGFI
jgi:hypothetical protein